MTLRIVRIAVLVSATALAWAACNTSGLSTQPRATFSQLACLDLNGDDRIDGSDALAEFRVPDFNADGLRDDRDGAFLRGVDIALDPARAPCVDGAAKRTPEYLVAHGYFEPSDVSCDSGARPVLLVGVGGGVVNLREKDDASGIRAIVDALQREYDDRDIETIGVLAGPAIVGAANVHAGMEQWMTHAVQVYLDRFSCLRAVLVGHSHGAVTADVIAARLEREYANRIIAVVDVDRVEALYIGDLTARPVLAPVLNIYETNDGILRGYPYDSPNAENWDASAVTAAGDGDARVSHTTIDNAKAVRDRIVDEVIERSGLPAR